MIENTPKLNSELSLDVTQDQAGRFYEPQGSVSQKAKTVPAVKNLRTGGSKKCKNPAPVTVQGLFPNCLGCVSAFLSRGLWLGISSATWF